MKKIARFAKSRTNQLLGRKTGPAIAMNFYSLKRDVRESVKK
jgi:hypothetical protein